MCIYTLYIVLTLLYRKISNEIWLISSKIHEFLFLQFIRNSQRPGDWLGYTFGRGPQPESERQVGGIRSSGKTFPQRIAFLIVTLIKLHKLENHFLYLS